MGNFTRRNWYLLVLGLSGWLGRAAPAAETDLHEFGEIAAGHYQVLAESGRPTALDVNRFMNLMLAQYSRFFNNWSRKQPARVVVFRNGDSFRQYVGTSCGLTHAGLTGLCQLRTEADGSRYVELVAFQGGDLYEVLAHEGFHQFVYYELGTVTPTWLNEGLAQYFETAVVLPDKMQVGRVSSSKLRVAQAIVRSEQGPSIEELIRMDQRTFYATASVTYPLAWALAHYLLERNGRNYRDSTLKKYLGDLRLGRDPVASFGKRFGRSPRELQREFGTYVLRLSVNDD